MSDETISDNGVVQITEKVEYALCSHTDHKPLMRFTDRASLDNWIAKQLERHGTAPSALPCMLTTRTVTEIIK